MKRMQEKLKKKKDLKPIKMKETFFIAAILFVFNLCFNQKEKNETKLKFDHCIKKVIEIKICK